MPQVYLTDRSLSDIQSIYEYSLTKWGKNTAEKYLDNLQYTLSLIGQNPGILKVNPEISDRFIAYQVKSHWLICIFLESDVYVLTVKHASIDLLNRLKKLAPSLEEESNFLYKQLKKNI